MGRVCCDAEGRLNDQSVMLEGSAADSAGARVRLDLSQARLGPQERCSPKTACSCAGSSYTSPTCSAVHHTAFERLPCNDVSG